MDNIDGNRIGEFLRARREQITPADVGIAVASRRRVPGLRREEIAVRAGISSEYYLRLEQGREQHPSDAVIAGLARALQLDADATTYLFEIARPIVQRPRPPEKETVAVGIRQLLYLWTATPAYVQSRTLDVLASNETARALSPIFTPGVNLIRAAFLDPEVKSLYRDWDRMTSNTVAGLRAQAGNEVGDPKLAALVDELTAKSPEFSRLWTRHDVRPKGAGRSFLHHPLVGDLDLRYEKLAVGEGRSGQIVVIYHADPGSSSETRLALLSKRATDGVN
ncbi:helix-turn-helix transcriptional regulator [Conyzicola nivalis]|uniref:Transcriptional regulator n=1 Tax=Conyzicola nivalis TaxID=1477021 RepID=A0A916WGF3_9MICO|nr:helix-turn-helix transcriptional regulator [Conyzicola nivalis]GGA94817.1 transcriptional regulator [Conyzicola nivalis]